MRLADSIEKNGYFWLPGEEEDVLSGILKISEKGKVTLELMVPVEFPKATVQTPWAFSSDDNTSFDKIIGKVEGDEFVTLCQCECLTPFSGSNTLQAAVSGPVSLQTSKFISQYAIIGRNHFGKKEEEVHFSRCRVSFEGLEELLDTGSISVEQTSSSRVTMEYNHPDPASFKIPYESDDVELTLDFHSSGISFPLRNRLSLKQRIYISLSSDKSLSFESYRSLIWGINKFLCLAIDKPVSFESATIFSKEKLEYIGDEEQETPMNLYFSGNSHPEIEADISWTTFLFFYRANKKANEIKKFIYNLSYWMQSYEKHRIPINLYFASVYGGGNIEPKFLSLVQGIEVLHRQLTSSKNRLLIDRVKEMVEEFKDDFFVDDTERENFAQNVTNERNWLTHYERDISPFMKEYNIKGFIELNQKLEALFQLYLMKLAGMELEEIKGIVKNNHNIRYKLGLLI